MKEVKAKEYTLKKKEYSKLTKKFKVKDRYLFNSKKLSLEQKIELIKFYI